VLIEGPENLYSSPPPSIGAKGRTRENIATSTYTPRATSKQAHARIPATLTLTVFLEGVLILLEPEMKGPGRVAFPGDQALSHQMDSVTERLMETEEILAADLDRSHRRRFR
jgi:hypothetical protein